MHIFKTSAETYESVITNRKHAFRNRPKDLSPGDIVIISKNKSGLNRNEKQISHYAILKNIRDTTDSEIEMLWPGNPGRWSYITEFSEVKKLTSSFDLVDVLSKDRAAHYGSIMTHGKIDTIDEVLLISVIGLDGTVNSPEELSQDEEIFEGAKRQITVNSYERDRKARAKCIEEYGYECFVCCTSLENIYGEIGKDYIHVHHKTPLYLVKAEYIVNPKEDLIPVCPNCHAMLHRTNPPLDVLELKEIYNGRQSEKS